MEDFPLFSVFFPACKAVSRSCSQLLRCSPELTDCSRPVVWVFLSIFIFSFLNVFPLTCFIITYFLPSMNTIYNSGLVVQVYLQQCWSAAALQSFADLLLFIFLFFCCILHATHSSIRFTLANSLRFYPGYLKPLATTLCRTNKHRKKKYQQIWLLLWDNKLCWVLLKQ